jgi:hypothetical protein
MKTKIACLLAATFIASPAFAQDFETISGFKTPSGNIHCLAFREKVGDEPYKSHLRCDMSQNNAKIPPKPKTCEFDWGNYFGISAVGRARRECVSDSVAGNYAVLPYGKKWVVKGAFSCNVTRSRLRCVNTSDRGFELSVNQQKLF